MSRIKHIIIMGVLIIAVFSAYLHLARGKTTEAHMPEDLIRFHVIANSDTEADQKLKIDVKDAVLDAIGSDFNSPNSAEEAREVV